MAVLWKPGTFTSLHHFRRWYNIWTRKHFHNFFSFQSSDPLLRPSVMVMAKNFPILSCGGLRISSSSYAPDKTKNIFLQFSTVVKIYHLTYSIFFIYSAKKYWIRKWNQTSSLFLKYISCCHHYKHITGEVWFVLRFFTLPLIIRKRQ